MMFTCSHFIFQQNATSSFYYLEKVQHIEIVTAANENYVKTSK